MVAEGAGEVQESAQTFGYWLRRRRKAMDLTQEALARRVSCSAYAIRKIEADERRPSRGLAGRLAVALGIPEAERAEFLDTARKVYAAATLNTAALPIETGAGASPEVRHGVAEPGVSCDASPFVGRGNEFALLTGLVARISAGSGNTVLLEGEPGIGKSRLMREIAAHAAGLGLRTLATNCYEIDRATPYQPVIDLVSRALDRASDAALGSMAAVSLAELAALVPELGERCTDLPQLSNAFPEARQMRLARAVGQLLDAASGGRPYLLMVDDIQWADDASAQVLHFLARHVAQRPVLLIYAYRGEDADNDEQLARLVESLRRDTDARSVPLQRLGYADTRRLVDVLVGSGADADFLAERLHRETDGNPFFLTSILQSLGDGETPLTARAADRGGFLPDALRAAVRARLAHVPRDMRPVLETAAVIGRRFDFDMLLDVTGRPEERLLAEVESLVRRRLLREDSDGDSFDFSHDKLREVVYRDIGGTRRRLLHQSVAEALERRCEDETPGRAARLGEHFERAHVWAKALQYLVLAGEHSLALFAMRDALHWLDRAVALYESHATSVESSQRLAIYERRGAARAHAGQTQGAVADFRLVIDAMRASGEAQGTRDALIQLGMAYRRADLYDEATACLTEALEDFRSVKDERRVADTLYHLGTVAWSTGHNDRAIGFHQEAVEICARTGLMDLVAVQAYHGRGEAHYAYAEPHAAIACFSRSLVLARAIGDKSYESENLMMIGHACVGSRGLGDYARATQNLEAALQIAQSADLQWHMGPILLGLDHVRACTGNYGEAWSGMTKTLAWLESLKQVRYQLIAHDFIGHLLLDLGQNELALEYVGRGIALGRDTGIAFWLPALEAHRAVARSRLGYREDASALQAALEHTRRSAECYMRVRCLEVLAEVSLSAGNARACLAYADELLALASADGLRELDAVARRWRGEALLLQEAHAEAQTELTRAASLANAVGRTRLQMDVEGALARLHVAQGERSVARRHDAEARGYAQSVEKSLAATGLEARFARRA